MEGRRLSVRVTAMANGIDITQAVSVRNTVHHAPLTHSYTPEVASALKFYDPGRTRIRH